MALAAVGGAGSILADADGDPGADTPRSGSAPSSRVAGVESETAASGLQRVQQWAPSLWRGGADSTPVPVGDLPGWRQTFVEDFTRDAPLGSFAEVYRGRWTGYEGWRDTTGKGLYSEARVVSVEDGVLDMHLRTEGGQPLAAAPVPVVTEPFEGQSYGRFSVRFRADPVPGYKVAWLLWPDSNTWAQGEINFPEGSLDATIGAFNHEVGNPSRNVLAHDTGVSFRDWHTATIEWSPGRVEYLLDGRLVATSDQAPTDPMHWVLQTETDLDGPPPPASAQGHVQVDWVAVYSRA